MAKRLWAIIIVTVLVVGAGAWALWPGAQPYRIETERVRIGDVTLDTGLYLPDSEEPVPAVLLAHGFGGSRESVAEDAAELAGRGYAVLTWTARGFGRSTGEIHLNSPDHEVKDARHLLDRLAERPEIRKDGPGDPRVGVVGGSYGGALALNLAGHDERVDAIVPQITYNDLANALLPEATGAGPEQGVFKKAWAGIFFGAGGGPPQIGGAGATASPRTETPVDTGDPQCGRFAKEICDAYLEVAASGRASSRVAGLLRENSPAAVLDRIEAPTLLIQGLSDSLFPLDEADANARGITNAPVRVAWFSGGHDGEASSADDQRVRALTAQWLDHYLRKAPDGPGISFTYSRVTGFDAQSRGPATAAFTTGTYPGLTSHGTRITVKGNAQRIASPPSGTPAAITALPGLRTGSVPLSAEMPGQHANFDSEPVTKPVDLGGSPTVDITAASPSGEAVLFVKAYDVAPDGQATLIGGQAAPVRLTGLPEKIADAEPVRVTLPGLVHRFDTGHRLRIVVAASDQAYAGPTRPQIYTVKAASGVTLPQIAGTPLVTGSSSLRWTLAAVVALILAGIGGAMIAARVRRGRRERTIVAKHADTPLHIRGLQKIYPDGFAAVTEVGFTVERERIVGLLGPNGAGKTTALRVLMGLTKPTGGEVLIFGHPLTAGAPVLSRLGALVEGPGFLPHLSGLDNLRLYWLATGRPGTDARLDEVLEIAGLGEAIHRRVGSYSHGMKQRLAIAQAMLGMPELLVLDEPTDGLDPPQIAEMRDVLRGYATAGRAVLLSSHLLAEVEAVCTDVVVMSRGRVVASGPVDEVASRAAGDGWRRLEDAFLHLVSEGGTDPRERV